MSTDLRVSNPTKLTNDEGFIWGLQSVAQYVSQLVSITEAIRPSLEK